MLYILLIIGFLLLAKGGDMLVDGASSLAKRYNISNIVIGLTIVAFGTSSPELFVNLTSSIEGNSSIALGNILGSNIANILLILGISALIKPLHVQRNTVWKEIPLSLMAVIIVFIFANDRLIDAYDFTEISRKEGLILLCFLMIFMYYIFSIAKTKDVIVEKIEKIGMLKIVSYIFLGLIGLIFGSKLLVDSAQEIARIFHVSEYIIALLVLAIGTSLPELMTSIMAAYRNNNDIAIGNVVGSNILNIFFILGVSSIISPITLNENQNIDIFVAIFAALLLFIFCFTDGKKYQLNRLHGFMFLGLYLAYITYHLH